MYRRRIKSRMENARKGKNIDKQEMKGSRKMGINSDVIGRQG
jgi:hypothetical protein